QTTRPVKELAAFNRISLPPDASTRLTFTLHADRTSFTGIDLTRIVEPGPLELYIGSSSTNLPCTATIDLTGPTRHVGHDRALTTPVRAEE
uniref:fibronectin type III-like domain-contianing protein n=1 Tax=Nocardia alni TaxID=2815723 RepID=UPI001C23352C